eukprot:jgi/Tetstr1/445621/TSEL_003426.t1
MASVSPNGPVPVAEVMARHSWQHANTRALRGQLEQVREIAAAGHPRMRLVTASKLREIGHLPRSSEGHWEDAEELLQRHGHEIGNGRSKLVTVLFSHRWTRPSLDAGEAHPDDPDGSKAAVMVQFADWLMWALNNRDVSGVGSKLPATSQKPSEVAFWLDWNSVDQDDTWPGVLALPLYVAACSVFAFYDTPEYEQRCWTRVERVMSYAFCAHGNRVFSIPPGFEHREQLFQEEKMVVRDPMGPDAGITRKEDREPVRALLEVAETSNAFSCWRVFVKNSTDHFLVGCALNICCCCQWCGCMAWVESRRLRLGTTKVEVLRLQ